MNLLAAVNSTGFGQVGASLFREFARLGPVSLFPLGGQPQPETAVEAKAISEAVGRAASYDAGAPSLRVWHHFDASLFPGKGRRGLYTFFEVDRLPRAEVESLNRLDFVAVPTAWGRDVLLNSGVTAPVRVVRCGVDTAVFHPNVEPTSIRKPTPETLVLLHIGKAEYRKGLDLVIDAFNAAFEEADDVFLMLHSFNPIQVPGFDGPAASREWAAYAADTKMGRAGRIAFNSFRLPNRAAVAGLMAAADVGVFPARAEGWNMEAVEMAAMGKPLILSRATAHLEYIDEISDTPVETDGDEPAYEPPFFNGSANWPAVSKDSLVEAYRKSFSDRRSGGPGRNVHGIDFGKRHPWSLAAVILRDLMGGGCVDG